MSLLYRYLASVLESSPAVLLSHCFDVDELSQLRATMNSRDPTISILERAEPRHANSYHSE